MDSLYNIFQREKKRVGDRFDVRYDKNRNSLQYSNSEGVLTVVFDEKKGSEDFYYKHAGEKNAVLIKQLMDYGHRGIYSPEEMQRCPREVINLMQDYTRNRKQISVEKPSDDILVEAACKKYIFKGVKLSPPITPEEIDEIIANYEENKAIDEALARGELSEEDIVREENVRYYLDVKSFLE